MSDFKAGDKVMYRDSSNVGGVYPCEVTAVADTTFGPSVQIRHRRPGAPRFWAPPSALVHETDFIGLEGTA